MATKRNLIGRRWRGGRHIWECVEYLPPGRIRCVSTDRTAVGEFQVKGTREAVEEYEHEQAEASRDRATQPKVGDQTACKHCGFDIEYHGKGQWADRGNDKHCPVPLTEAGSRTATKRKHQPISDQ